MSVDASEMGTECVLLQDGHPISYGSNAFNNSQKNFFPIEREMMAIVHACKKFHNYIYGQDEVVVLSDHQPLERIVKKSLNEAPRRLQAMLLEIQKYQLKVKYVPGKSLCISDTRSRAPVFDADEKS